jgi:hypothetical protein
MPPLPLCGKSGEPPAGQSFASRQHHIFFPAPTKLKVPCPARRSIAQPSGGDQGDNRERREIPRSVFGTGKARTLRHPTNKVKTQEIAAGRDCARRSKNPTIRGFPGANVPSFSAYSF